MPDLEPDGLYHLSTPDEWAASRSRGLIAPASLETEGFVHCSWGRQVAGTLTKHFAGGAEVLALRLDPGRLGELRVVEEDSYGSGQSFPHLYGPVPVDAVTEITTVSPRS